jgi:hypothetical protein
MRFYILKAKDSVDYDETRSMIVRANSGKEARFIASAVHSRWLDSKQSTCKSLRLIGPPAIILEDILEG